MLQIRFDKFLQTRLNASLPGKTAQNKMAPRPANGKTNSHHQKPMDQDYRNSSVLVPIISWKDPLEIVLTLRAPSIKHGGQLSFPGGGREGDESVEETALREAQEEIGLHIQDVDIIGRLTSLYVGHSSNMVTPVVGFLRKEQTFIPNPNEVEEVITVPLEDLAKQQHLENEEWHLKGTSYHVPYWNIHRVPLWGATAMMLNEIVELYKEFQAELST